MHQVLFVCTANVFRSLTAEYAVRQLLASRNGFQVSSAGTDNRWYEVPPYITSYLATRGFDVRRHRRRTLTADMMHSAVTVIAMSSDHQEHIARQFGRHDVPLFTQACGHLPTPLPDVHEVVPDYATNPRAAEAHVRATIDRIIELAPQFASRLIRRAAA